MTCINKKKGHPETSGYPFFSIKITATYPICILLPIGRAEGPFWRDHTSSPRTKVRTMRQSILRPS